MNNSKKEADEMIFLKMLGVAAALCLMAWALLDTPKPYRKG